MKWPSEGEIISAAREYAGKVAVFSAKAEKVLVLLRDNKTAQEIEALVPGHEKIVAAISKVIPIAHALSGAVPIVNDVYALYTIYENFGGKPMEWGRPNDPEAEARLRERDALTNG